MRPVACPASCASGFRRPHAVRPQFPRAKIRPTAWRATQSGRIRRREGRTSPEYGALFTHSSRIRRTADAVGPNPAPPRRSSPKSGARRRVPLSGPARRRVPLPEPVPSPSPPVGPTPSWANAPSPPPPAPEKGDSARHRPEKLGLGAPAAGKAGTRRARCRRAAAGRPGGGTAAGGGEKDLGRGSGDPARRTWGAVAGIRREGPGARRRDSSARTRARAAAPAPRARDPTSPDRSSRRIFQRSPRASRGPGTS